MGIEDALLLGHAQAHGHDLGPGRLGARHAALARSTSLAAHQRSRATHTVVGEHPISPAMWRAVGAYAGGDSLPLPSDRFGRDDGAAGVTRAGHTRSACAMVAGLRDGRLTCGLGHGGDHLWVVIRDYA
jgi:hypothetical protein